MRKIKKIRFSMGVMIFLGVILGSVILLWQKAETQAYSSDNTHPILAEQTARLFNKVYGAWLGEQEIGWLKQGAVNEDQAPRWINHFYDPSTSQGWNSQRMGSLPQSVVSVAAKLGLSQESALSALDWAHNQAVQSRYVLYQGNRTLESAIFDFSQNNQQRAFQSLGHLLHLIEDLSVPAHTRQDTHLDILNDPGEPYEKWAKEQTLKYGLAGLAPLTDLASDYQPICADLDDCLKKTAFYSNQNFFSEDTIKDSFYSNPIWETVKQEEQNGEVFKYGIRKDAAGNDYRVVLLVGESAFSWKNELGKRDYTIKDDSIHHDYWRRLSRQAILAGVETIRYFKQEAEKARFNPPVAYQPSSQVMSSPMATPMLELANKLILSRLNVPTVPVVSPYAETIKAKSWWDQAKGLASQAVQKTQQVFQAGLNKAGNVLSSVIGVFSQNSSPSPTLPLTKREGEKSVALKEGEGEDGRDSVPTKEQSGGESQPSSSQTSSFRGKGEEVFNWQAEVADQSPDMVVEAGTGRDLSLPEQPTQFWLELRNQGRSWLANQVSLNVWQISSNGPKVTWQDVYDNSWLTAKRPVAIKQPVNSGVATFLNFSIKTRGLAPGTYTLKFRPVYQDSAGFHWLGSAIISWQIIIKERTLSQLAAVPTAPTSEQAGTDQLTGNEDFGLALPQSIKKEPTSPDQIEEAESTEEDTEEDGTAIASNRTSVSSAAASTATDEDGEESETVTEPTTPAAPATSTPSTTPPEKPVILSPANQSDVKENPILLQGMAASSTLKILIQVNQATTTLEALVLIDASWQKEIDLLSGENSLTIWAEDDQLKNIPQAIYQSEKVHWQIFLDQAGPEIILSIVEHQMVSREITLAWQPASAEDAADTANYILEIKPPSGDWQALWQQATSSQKTFSGFNNGLYQFRACGQDALGNQGVWEQTEVLFEERPVVINEIAWMGTFASTNDEWLELFNRTSQAIDLTGWRLEAEDGTPSTTLSKIIEPNEYFLLERTDDETVSDIEADLIYGNNGTRWALNNDGEDLILKDNLGNIVDEIDFSADWPEGDNATKASMERIKPELAGSEPDSWMTNQGLTKNGLDAKNQPIRGTPRHQNSYLQDGGTKIPDYLRIRDKIVWSKRLSPYILSFNMDGYVAVESGAKLVIEPGVVLKMGLTYLNLRVYGELEARGTTDEPIVFMPLDSVTAWSATVFEPSSTGIFERVLFQSGGARGFYHQGGGWSAESWTQSALVAYQADVIINDCDFSEIQISGLQINQSDAIVLDSRFSGGTTQIEIMDANPLIQGNIFQNNLSAFGQGLLLRRGDPQILDNHFENIGTIAVLAGGNPYFSGNTSQNIFQYNGILVDDGTRFSQDVSWQSNFPYILEVNFRDQARVLAGASLTLEPGVVVKMMGYADVAGYENLIIEGTLKAQAPTSTPIIFTSLFDDTISGDTNCDDNATFPASRLLPTDGWRGILFTNNSSDSILDGVVFRYASQAIIKESAAVDLTLGEVDYY